MDIIIKEFLVIGLMLPVMLALVAILIIAIMHSASFYIIPNAFHRMIFGPPCIEFPESATIHEGWTADGDALANDGYSQEVIAAVRERLDLERNSLLRAGFSQTEIEAMPKSWAVDKDGKVRTLGNMLYNKEKDCYTRGD